MALASLGGVALTHKCSGSGKLGWSGIDPQLERRLSIDVEVEDGQGLVSVLCLSLVAGL